MGDAVTWVVGPLWDALELGHTCCRASLAPTGGFSYVWVLQSPGLALHQPSSSRSPWQECLDCSALVGSTGLALVHQHFFGSDSVLCESSSSASRPVLCRAGTGLVSHGQASECLVSDQCHCFIHVSDGAGGLRQVQELRMGLYLLSLHKSWTCVH